MTDDYFAGLFDGEGTIRISDNKRQYQLLVSLGMTDRRPVDALKARFGGWVETRSNVGTPWQPIYIWRGASTVAVRMLDALENRLVVKREHARVAREFQTLMSHRTPMRDPAKAQCYEDMKVLNRRGR